jgi:hypothetical protein
LRKPKTDSQRLCYTKTRVGKPALDGQARLRAHQGARLGTYEVRVGFASDGTERLDGEEKEGFRVVVVKGRKRAGVRRRERVGASKIAV